VSDPAQVQTALIVGSGFAGLGMGIRLKQAGIHDFTIVEQGPSLGGTWRDNTYPGAACDVESHLYSFSYEPNPRWSRMFAPHHEIKAYLEHCADKYGVRPHLRFNTAATGATFDDSSGVWTVQCSDGVARQARGIIAACGGLSVPAKPEIPGLESFEGKLFHSARWDHSFPLGGKTVAVIGTGASAIQIVPGIAGVVGKLQVFQRTPPWIMPKADRDLTPAEQARFRRVPALQQLARLRQYWTHELMAVGFVVEPRILRLASGLALKHLRASIRNPVLLKQLTPTYTMGCKRILLSNDYYPALERPNVELVTEGILEVRPHSIVTRDGREHPVDVIVLATGFQAAEAAAPFEVRGRAGADLNETWRAGPEAFLGTTVSGFPNLFLLVGPNTGLGHSSMVFMIESQVEYVLSALRTLRKKGLRFVDVLPDAQARYNAELQERLGRTVWSTGCSSWYQTRSGRNTTLWPGFTFEFRRRTRRFDPDAYLLVK
jgi:cation diffusion facilitator CzcD-associated flavoprotein CzcO